MTTFTAQGRLHPYDIGRFRILILNAGVAAALAFVPSFLFSMGYSGTSLWRTASAVMVAAALVSSATSWLQSRGVPSSLAKLLPISSLGILNLVLQGVNATGLVWSPGGAAYLAGTLVWLTATVVLFVVIVVDRPTV